MLLMDFLDILKYESQILYKINCVKLLNNTDLDNKKCLLNIDKAVTRKLYMF